MDVSFNLSSLPGLLNCGVPAVNLSIEGSVLGVATAAALPDEFGFVAASGISPPPSSDLARLSTAMLAVASQREGAMFGAWAFTNNGSLLPGQDASAVVTTATGIAE